MEEKIQELASMTTTDVVAITPKIIANAIEEVAREKVIWSQFYKVNRDLMSNGGTEVVFPKKGTGVVASWGLTAGQGLTASAMTYSAVTIAVVKGGVGIGLYGEAVRQANRDVITDCINEAGMTWAETLDIAAFEAMFPTQSFTACNKGTFVAATVPILGVKSVNPATLTGFTIVNNGTGSSITYATDVVGTITVWTCPSTAGYANATSSNTMTVRDVLTAKNGIIGYKYKPSVVIVHPERLADLIYDASAKFVEKSAYEGVGPVYTGELGMIMGMKLLTSVHASSIAAVVLDPNALGYQVIRKELEMKRDEYTGMSLDALYFWGFSERQFGVVNNRAYGAVVVKGTYAVSAGIGSGYP
jgi:N4-gp56 family major capsid protein